MVSVVWIWWRRRDHFLQSVALLVALLVGAGGLLAGTAGTYSFSRLLEFEETQEGDAGRLQGALAACEQWADAPLLGHGQNHHRGSGGRYRAETQGIALKCRA